MSAPHPVMPLLHAYCAQRVAARRGDSTPAVRIAREAIASGLRAQAGGVERIAIAQAGALLHGAFVMDAEVLERRAINDCLWEPTT